MRRRIRFLALAGILSLVSGCAPLCRGTAGRTTTIAVAGPKGSTVSGYYVQDGQRFPLSAPLPFGLSDDGLTELQLFKDNPDTPFMLVAQSDERGWHWEAVNEAGQGVRGLRVLVHKGLFVDKIKP